MKKEKQDRWFAVELTPFVCVLALIDHGQQPMKMHTEAALLYNASFLHCITVH